MRLVPDSVRTVRSYRSSGLSDRSLPLEFPPLAGHFRIVRVWCPIMGSRVQERRVLLEGKRRRRRFSDEFKRDAVEIVRSSGRSVRQVAGELGIYDSTLGNWVRQDQINRGEREGLTSDERERFGELEREWSFPGA